MNIKNNRPFNPAKIEVVELLIPDVLTVSGFPGLEDEFDSQDSE